MDPIRPITPGDTRMPIPPVRPLERVGRERRRRDDDEPSGRRDADASDAQQDYADGEDEEAESYAGPQDYSEPDGDQASNGPPRRVEFDEDDGGDGPPPAHLIDISA